MVEPRVYLEKLSAFSRLLRLQGLTVSPEETADAARLLVALGLEDRETVKTALRTVYAKTREQQLTFDQVFDGFFLSEEAMRKQAAEHAARQAAEQAAQQELEQVPVSFTPEQREAYGMLPEAERQRLRDFSERYRDNALRNPELYGNFIHSVFAKAMLEQQMLQEDAALGVAAADPELGLLYRDISRFQDAEIPRAVDLIGTVARQVSAELAARQRSSGRSGKLDFRRTIRKGLETGGSLQKLKWRKKPRRRRQLVLLCDVSGSMMQFSEFALRFIQALDQASENAKTFLFSEKLVEADPFRLQNMDLFRQYVDSSGVYGRGTDLGGALRELCARRPPVFSPSTTLLILSDTKTVDPAGAAAALKTAMALCGKVVWLNPIPRGKWKYIRSVQAMEALCTMVPCSTLGELAAACRRLMVGKE